MRENSEKISIVMPAYNSEQYIAESIQSVIDQTYKDWELIIIDDGSTDDTIKIVLGFIKRDSRIKLYSNGENVGVSATRNKGIGLASNEWIAFLDSDDMWEPLKLEKQIYVSLSEGVDFIYTGSSYVDENGRAFRGLFEVPRTITYSNLKNQNKISCSSVLIRKKYFDDIKMENDSLHEDYVVWLRILRQYSIVARGVNEPLLKYRISRKSKSGNKFKSIRMTYKVFRFIGINPIFSMYYTCRHLLGSVIKYTKIFK